MKAGNCKHYNGNVYKRKECDAGINTRSLVGGSDTGWLIRTPCMKKHCTDIVCDKYEDPTADEIAEDNAWIEREIDKLRKAVPTLEKLKHDYPNGGSGEIECPVCSGELQFSVSSYNLHVHGKCKTENCLCFME